MKISRGDEREENIENDLWCKERGDKLRRRTNEEWRASVWSARNCSGSKTEEIDVVMEDDKSKECSMESRGRRRRERWVDGVEENQWCSLVESGWRCLGALQGLELGGWWWWYVSLLY